MQKTVKTFATVLKPRQETKTRGKCLNFIRKPLQQKIYALCFRSSAHLQTSATNHSLLNILPSGIRQPRVKIFLSALRGGAAHW